jgi:O-antigen/teichoic acid export membrane protein
LTTNLKFLNNHKGFKKYFNNTSWLLAERVLRLFITLIIGLYVARYLGPIDFGKLSYATSFVGILSIFIQLGLDGIVVRDLVNNPKIKDKILGALFTLKIFGSLIMVGLLIIVSIIMKHESQITLLIAIIALSSILTIVFDVIRVNYEASVLVKYVSIIQMTQLVVSSILKLYCVAIGAHLLWFAIIYVVDTLLLSGLSIVIYRNKTGSIRSWKVDWGIVKKLIVDGWPGFLSGIAGVIYMKIDQIMIGNMIDHNALGIYSAATRLSTAWYFLPMVIVTSLTPAIIKAKQQGSKIYYDRIQKLHDLLFIVAICIAIPTSIIGDTIVLYLFGSDYLGAGTVLVIHIWASIFVFLGVAGGRWYVAENLLVISFYRHLAGLIINITLNIYMIPKFGIVGAAISTLISYSFSSYIFDVINIRSRPLFIVKSKSLFFFGGYLIKDIYKNGLRFK